MLCAREKECCERRFEPEVPAFLDQLILGTGPVLDPQCTLLMSLAGLFKRFSNTATGKWVHCLAILDRIIHNSGVGTQR